MANTSKKTTTSPKITTGAEAIAKAPVIEGNKIVKNRKYIIKDKIDGTVEPALAEIGRRKSASIGVGDTSFIRFNSATNKYDLGLDLSSVDFYNKSESEAKAILKDREYVLQCAKQVFGNDFLNNCTEDNKMFSNERFQLEFKNGTILDTSTSVDTIKLHAMLLDGKLAWKNDSMGLKMATHTVECLDEVKTQNEVAIEEKYLLDKWFLTLIASGEKRKLVAIVRDGNSSVKYDISEALLKSKFDTMVSSVSQRRKLIAYMENTGGLFDNVEDLDIVRELIRKGTISKKSGKYVYNGVELGIDPNVCLSTLNQMPDLFDQLKAMA